jgi:hypothetical protein
MAITWTTVTNPRWADSDQTIIDLDVNFTHLPEEVVTFAASANDVEAHGQTLYNNAINGDYGTIAAYSNE